MDESQREFLYDLLRTPSPSGFEASGQRVWVDYLEPFADAVRTDAYGNAVAVHEGTGEQSVALAGHGDEIGLMVREVTDEGFVGLSRIGGSDRTVTRGQHVTVHAADGPVHGVVGQNAIHLREGDEDDVKEITEQYVDVGAGDGEAARDLVSVGDPITFASDVEALAGDRLAGRGMDNRTGTWAAAEGFRRAVEAGTETTVYAVSTVQEEVGLRGAEMVGFDLDPDVFVGVDVTHATDYPEAPSGKTSPVELGGGPVLGRGTQNHPVLVEAARTVADEEGIDVQLVAAGAGGGTDAVEFYTSRGGTPTLDVGLPNRYMHTPVEVIDTRDLDEVATVMGGLAARAGEFAPFRVDV
ncbi:MAG: M20/M25/M40 family metallo-hydrolase [Haloarculaceae archaeon]